MMLDTETGCPLAFVEPMAAGPHLTSRRGLEEDIRAKQAMRSNSRIASISQHLMTRKEKGRARLA